MADARADLSKLNKKDQRSSRDLRDELGEEIRSSGTQPHVAQPNRDRARGDWDRTGDHHDENQNDQTDWDKSER